MFKKDIYVHFFFSQVVDMTFNLSAIATLKLANHASLALLIAQNASFI